MSTDLDQIDRISVIRTPQARIFLQMVVLFAVVGITIKLLVAHHEGRGAFAVAAVGFALFISTPIVWTIRGCRCPRDGAKMISEFSQYGGRDVYRCPRCGSKWKTWMKRGGM